MQDELKEYLDGELPEARRIQVERALETDPHLAEELKQLRLVGRAVAMEAPPPVRGREEALISLTNRPALRRRRLINAGWATAAAATVGLILIEMPRPAARMAEMRVATYTRSVPTPRLEPQGAFLIAALLVAFFLVVVIAVRLSRRLR